jgi:hypothetical protein
MSYAGFGYGCKSRRCLVTSLAFWADWMNNMISSWWWLFYSCFHLDEFHSYKRHLNEVAAVYLQQILQQYQTK